jgi:hypothetical protein
MLLGRRCLAVGLSGQRPVDKPECDAQKAAMTLYRPTDPPLIRK